MKTKFLITLSIICLTSAFLTPHILQTQSDFQTTTAPEGFTIEGLVENPTYITYAELQSFPLLSEVTTLQCVGGGQGGPKITYNWTGVPLFHILNMAKIIPGAYREVVFNATDGFSSSIPLDDAMHPTTILALWANGTDLEQIQGLGSGYRVALPCRWGYKWVKWIKQIIVVDYDYKGHYEQMGFSDEAVRPNCTMPTTNPPLQKFNATSHGKKYVVQALTNSSLESFSFENTRLVFNFSEPKGADGYLYVAFPKELLEEPYHVLVDESPVDYCRTDTNENVYFYLSFTNSSPTVTIEGTSAAINGGGGCLRRPLMT